MSPNVGDSLCQHTAHLRGFKTLLSEIELCVLHRFAQFFQSPLFNASATDREVKAVDSGERRNSVN